MTPYEYKALYEKYGIRPTDEIYISISSRKACLVGIRLIDLAYGDLKEAHNLFSNDFGFQGTSNLGDGKPWYWNGLDAGFCNFRSSYDFPGEKEKEDYLEGVAEGKAAREFLKDQFDE